MWKSLMPYKQLLYNYVTIQKCNGVDSDHLYNDHGSNCDYFGQFSVIWAQILCTDLALQVARKISWGNPLSGPCSLIFEI